MNEEGAVAHDAEQDTLRTPESHTRVADTRRRDLMEAAQALIATRGLEGLRTRDVAARAGVNIATLHYYFATKEALIAGVVTHLSDQFRTVHAPRLFTGAGTPLQRLRQEFADARFYQIERLELWLAINELSIRALRDPAIASILHRLDRYWYVSLDTIIAEGIDTGDFRADLDSAVVTDILLGFLRGTRLPITDPFAYDRACATFERWLLAPEQLTDAVPVAAHKE